MALLFLRSFNASVLPFLKVLNGIFNRIHNVVGYGKPRISVILNLCFPCLTWYGRRRQGLPSFSDFGYVKSRIVNIIFKFSYLSTYTHTLQPSLSLVLGIKPGTSCMLGRCLFTHTTQEFKSAPHLLLSNLM